MLAVERLESDSCGSGSCNVQLILKFCKFMESTHECMTCRFLYPIWLCYMMLLRYYIIGEPETCYCKYSCASVLLGLEAM